MRCSTSIEKKKYRDRAWVKREAILAQLIQCRNGEETASGKPSFLGDLDPRWLDLAVRVGNLHLVQILAVPGHAGAMDFLTSQFRGSASGCWHGLTGFLC